MVLIFVPCASLPEGNQTVTGDPSSPTQLMSSGSSGSLPPQPGLPGLVAISATLLAIPGILATAGAFVYIWFVRPDLKVDSLLLLLLGAAVLSVAMFAVTGLFAGILEVIQTRSRKGIASLAITVNTIILLAIGGLLVIGALV